MTFGRKELAKQVLPEESYQPPAPISRKMRPFLEAIHADRLRKQVELNRLDNELSRLVTMELWLETHETTDSLVEYFLKNAPQTTKGGSE